MPLYRLWFYSLVTPSDFSCSGTSSIFWLEHIWLRLLSGMSTCSWQSKDICKSLHWCKVRSFNYAFVLLVFFYLPRARACMHYFATPLTFANYLCLRSWGRQRRNSQSAAGPGSCAVKLKFFFIQNNSWFPEDSQFFDCLTIKVLSMVNESWVFMKHHA